MEKLPIDYNGNCRYSIFMQLEQASQALEALGSPVRLNIFRMLVRAGNKGLFVGQIQEQLDIPRSTVSHHLQKLVQEDLVIQSKSGTSLCCCANFNQMVALLGFLTEECCVDDSCSTTNSTDNTGFVAMKDIEVVGSS